MTTIDANRFICYDKKFCFQVRIHREFFTVKDTMEDYLNGAEISFVFQHEADAEVNRTHCHSYMFDLRRTRTTIDGYLRKRFHGNADFSVSQTCGRKNKRPLDVIGAWCYGTTEKLLKPSYTKGLSEAEIEFLNNEAREFWKKIEDSRKTGKQLEIVEVIIEKEHKDNIWQDYYTTVFLEWKKGTDSKFLNWSYDKFKRWIVVDYLNRAKAPPRVADRNRYAYGLYVLNTNGFDRTIIVEDIMKCEY